jgi:signal transduction histidine kinase
MAVAKKLDTEIERLNELYKYELLDTGSEPEFDDLALLASNMCNVPFAAISLIDMNRHWNKAIVGMDNRETERTISFCNHTILGDTLMEVHDTLKDSRFQDNPLVTGAPHIRFYAGIPLITGAGFKLGTLSVMDREPGKLSPDQVFALQALSRQVMKLFELRLCRKEFKKVRDVQYQMMTVIAHDIRGPLGSLRSVYELKNSGNFTDEEAVVIDAMVPRQLDSTIDLLNNILDWSNLLIGKTLNKKEVFSLFALCDECINHLSEAADAKDNQMINGVAPSFKLNGNRHGMEFVLRNLLGNANKYTDGGEILVSANKTKSHIEISVIDKGIGMSPDVIESLTTRTWSVYTPGTQNEKGSGLGLKLIYEYLNSIGGSIRFSTIADEGTTVVVTLPLA